jgi:uncharacterized protein YeaO (DUF488 family)
MIKLKRVYDDQKLSDGPRFLVERLWPRGIRKADLTIDGWLKDIGPSDGLRRWFGHDPKKWELFRKRYFAELDSNPEVLETLLKAARRGPVTLIYSSHDTTHNNAVALKDYLEMKLKKRTNHHRPKIAA